MNIAELWGICIKFMWDNSYIQSLDTLFRKNNVKTILDCGGGTGFPSLELKKIGWDIIYSDESKLMFDHFNFSISPCLIPVAIAVKTIGLILS